MEWDKSNYKKFKKIFGIKSDKILTVDTRHLHASRIFINKFLNKYKNHIEYGDSATGYFTANFKDDLKKYGFENHIRLEAAEIKDVFKDENYNPYENINDAIKKSMSAVRASSMGSESKGMHPPQSVTWSEFYFDQTTRRKGGLLELYKRFFNKVYKDRKDKEVMSSRMSRVLFEKAFARAVDFGQKFQSGESVRDKTSVIRAKGINALIAIHGSRSDLAGGEKESITSLMQAFCLKSNLFEVNEQEARSLMETDLDDINIKRSPDSILSSVFMDSHDFSQSKFVVKRICEEVESKILKIFYKKNIDISNLKKILNVDFISENIRPEFLNLTKNFGRENLEKFCDNSYGTLDGGNTFFCKSIITKQDILFHAMTYYSDKDVMEAMGDPETKKDEEYWGLRVFDLAESIFTNKNPIISTSFYSKSIMGIAGFIKKSEFRRYRVEKDFFLPKK